MLVYLHHYTPNQRVCVLEIPNPPGKIECWGSAKWVSLIYIGFVQVKIDFLVEITSFLT